MKTSVNVGSAFPIPSTTRHPGSVRYSDTAVADVRPSAWVYRARRIATGIALLVLAFVGLWAFNELGKGLDALFDLFSPPEEDGAFTGALRGVGIPWPLLGGAVACARAWATRRPSSHRR